MDTDLCRELPLIELTSEHNHTTTDRYRNMYMYAFFDLWACYMHVHSTKEKKIVKFAFWQQKVPGNYSFEPFKIIGTEPRSLVKQLVPAHIHYSL